MLRISGVATISAASERTGYFFLIRGARAISVSFADGPIFNPSAFEASEKIRSAGDQFGLAFILPEQCNGFIH
jgi:hypothetical protein